MQATQEMFQCHYFDEEIKCKEQIQFTINILYLKYMIFVVIFTHLTYASCGDIHSSYIG